MASDAGSERRDGGSTADDAAVSTDQGERDSAVAHDQGPVADLATTSDVETGTPDTGQSVEPDPGVVDESSENPFDLDPDYESAAELGGADARRQPYGTALGDYRGVVTYSNYKPCAGPGTGCWFDTGNGRTRGRHGYQYQCVEYVVRFYDQALHYGNLSGSGDAKLYWYGPLTARARDLERYENGGTVPPQPDDLIVFDGQTYGHVAIVRAVTPVGIRIIQQNYFHTAADNDHFLPMDHTSGRFTVRSLGTNGSLPVLGWRRVPGSTVQCYVPEFCDEPPADCNGQGLLCAAGEQRCSGDGDIETCSATGCSWNVSQDCACGCQNGACRALAGNPGTRRCNDAGDVETCAASGCSWDVTQDCACGCLGGTCVAQACSPGGRRCNGNGDVESCDGGGCGWSVTQDCACGCQNGACQAQSCNVGERRCNGNGDVESCNGGGCNWSVSQDCACGCQNGACQAQTCSPGELRCNGDLEECDWAGCSWTVNTACPAGCDDLGCIEACNGVDDDLDGRTDNAGSSGLDCFSEVWSFVRTGEANNERLQWSNDYGNVPAPPDGYEYPGWMSNLGQYPSFLLYRDTFGLPYLTKLYFCVKTSPPYDNLYTTNWIAECGGYEVKGEDDFIGYLFTQGLGQDKRYGNWLYAPYFGDGTKPMPLWRLRRPATNQHKYTTIGATVASRVDSGWCCERGPAPECAGHWCGGQNTNPVGWILLQTH